MSTEQTDVPTPRRGDGGSPLADPSVLTQLLRTAFPDISLRLFRAGSRDGLEALVSIGAAQALGLDPHSAYFSALAVERRAPVLIERLEEADAPESLRSRARRAGLAACWAWPIRAADEALGTIELWATRPGAPTASQRVILEVVGALAAGAFLGAVAEEQQVEAAPTQLVRDPDEVEAMRGRRFARPVAGGAREQVTEVVD